MSVCTLKEVKRMEAKKNIKINSKSKSNFTALFYPKPQSLGYLGHKIAKVLLVALLLAHVSFAQKSTAKSETGDRATLVNNIHTINNSKLWDTTFLFQSPKYRIVDSSKVLSIIYEGPVFDGQ